MQEQLNYTQQFRKSAIYALVVLGLMGSLVQFVWHFFWDNPSSEPQLIRLALNLVLVLVMISLCWLTLTNKLVQAALVFCIVSTFTLSIYLVNLSLDSYFPVLYGLVILIAATLLNPRSSIFFGALVTVLYVAINTWKISQSARPVPVESGANTVILALVLIIATIILSGFSSSLGKLIYSVTHQANELARLNQNLLHLRQVEATTAQQVNELTGKLSMIFKEQDLTTQQQATMVHQVAVTTQEMDTSVRKIAENALTVAVVADKAQRNAEVSLQAAYQGATAISAVRQRVQDISENMRVLTMQIERISEVTNIIGEIADETNLLALNATIEAAGAREYGRRFAAVADEVQRLARRSTNAVEQIQSMVQEINLASNKALAATEQGLRETQLSDQLVGSLTMANNDVTQLVAKTSTLVSSIAEATQQQREASTQTVEVMQRIIITTDRLAEVGPEVSAIVHRLERASEFLALSTEDQGVQAGTLTLASKLQLTQPSRPRADTGPEVAAIMKN
ncbi:MAG: hypothetical protein JWP00_3761 [Chloroflexi bacterium]|jgi:methyl-accepting chemotaxis protein|nr:hypothetical protein [Chloroflexota bacterium]